MDSRVPVSSCAAMVGTSIGRHSASAARTLVASTTTPTAVMPTSVASMIAAMVGSRVGMSSVPSSPYTAPLANKATS